MLEPDVPAVLDWAPAGPSGCGEAVEAVPVPPRKGMRRIKEVSVEVASLFLDRCRPHERCNVGAHPVDGADHLPNNSAILNDVRLRKHVGTKTPCVGQDRDTSPVRSGDPARSGGISEHLHLRRLPQPPRVPIETCARNRLETAFLSRREHRMSPKNSAREDYLQTPLDLCAFPDRSS